MIMSLKSDIVRVIRLCPGRIFTLLKTTLCLQIINLRNIKLFLRTGNFAAIYHTDRIFFERFLTVKTLNRRLAVVTH